MSQVDPTSRQPLPSAPKARPGVDATLVAPTGPPPGARPISPATWAWLVALVGWTVVLAFYDLRGGAGLEPVEAWVAQPAREMYRSVSEMLANMDEAGWQWRPLVIPQLCGETRMQKSPGACWAVVATALLRGTPVDEVAARIPNATSAVLIVITIFWLARRIAGDRAAVFAGFAAASSSMVLYWSHSAASDMGVATLMTMSLACLWVASEDEPPGWKRNVLWLLGYFFAGLAMVYKMPLAVPCVGLPALLYVLIRRRWRIFASWWHLLGLLLFLLPWLPWALAAMHFEEMSLLKWRVEFFDRMTGDLPNIEAQKRWYWFLFYIGVACLLAIPYSLSIPSAIARAFRRRPDVNRDGMLFLVVWFFSLLAFFSVSVGKETRYFLPAMASLLILLGIELAAFFDPNRAARAARDRLAFWGVCMLVPGVLLALGFVLYYRFWQRHLAQGVCSWPQILQAYIVAAMMFAGGAILAAWLYRRRREHASFATLVGTMWLVWAWVWPMFMPIAASQAPYRDFAAQLETLPAEYRSRLRQLAQQDPRIVWYGDIRFPRVVDPLELLKEEGGVRDLEYEIRRVGEEAIRLLERDELALFVVSPSHYIRFQADGRIELEREGREMPKTYVWMIARVGKWSRRYMLFGNRPPPWPQPDLPAEIVEHIEKRLRKQRSETAAMANPDRSCAAQASVG